MQATSLLIDTRYLEDLSLMKILADELILKLRDMTINYPGYYVIYDKGVLFHS
jgi:hypothetical protein